jgi:hypothetical protein
MIMNRLMERLETGVAGLLWVAATILLPMAALAPVDAGSARAAELAPVDTGAAAAPAESGCAGIAVDMLRICPATAL